MLILFDHGAPRGVARALSKHTVVTARAQGWDQLSNGDLIAAAINAVSPGSYTEVPIPFE